MKIIVTGCRGQLGTEILKQLREGRSEIGPIPEKLLNATVLPVDLPELDISNYRMVDEFIRRNRPDVIINCAAYTNVDGCEVNHDAAFKANALGPRNLAQAAEKTGARLVHVSTDYVFSGRENGGIPQDEATIPGPISAYGSTKLMGQVNRVGGVAALVVDHLQLAEFPASVDDGLDEVLAVVAVQPCRADDKVAVAELLHILFAHELGGAVGADGAGNGGLVLCNAAVLTAGEHIVGGNVHQPCAGLFGSLRQIAGADGVGLESGVMVHLAAVHVGEGGAVDDDIRALAADEVIHHLIVGDVQLRQVHRDHGGIHQLFGNGADLAAALPQLLDDLGAQLALAASDDNFHAVLPLFRINISVCRRPRS